MSRTILRHETLLATLPVLIMTLQLGVSLAVIAWLIHREMLPHWHWFDWWAGLLYSIATFFSVCSQNVRPCFRWDIPILIMGIWVGTLLCYVFDTYCSQQIPDFLNFMSLAVTRGFYIGCIWGMARYPLWTSF
ncbi:hypothetical protein PMPD1_4408 (plasmid) [Paramixta manurensis]|uniref:Uncharacterized protein n=1 Tax=Paramixta manurensis TaxID=2740817 RepID=A0A6M8UEL7_9GAMM|nr:hypothetical protein PMPD1_4408 [Erwiniaceae bacterium PD-1]